MEFAKDFNTSLAIEYKVSKKSFSFSGWIKKSPHQLRALFDSASDRGVYHKISDQSMGTKPFDAFLLKNAEPFLIIYYDEQKTAVFLGADSLRRLTTEKTKTLKYEDAVFWSTATHELS